MSEVPGPAQPKEEFILHTFTDFQLQEASFFSDKHDTFEAFLENNQISPKRFINSLQHALQLVTNKEQTISDVTPALRVLLTYGAKRSSTWRFDGNVTPYHVICHAIGDHFELLELLIKEFGTSLINARDHHGTTPLICAVKNANINCLKSLIANGAYVNITTDNRHHRTVSPLINSIKNLHFNFRCSYDTMVNIFDILLDSGADVNQPCHRYQRTPMMYAAVGGLVSCVQKLIQKGADLHLADKLGQTVWMLAAGAGCVDVLQCLLEDVGIDKNSIDCHGFSILRWAVESKNFQTVSYLLNLGVTITTYIPQEYVELCKSCGTSIRCYCIHGIKRNTDPYMQAVKLNMLEVIKMMDEYGCQLYKSIDTLNYAIFMDSVEVVDYLLSKHNYPLNDEYSERYDKMEVSNTQTLLMIACHGESEKMVTLLLEHGADPNKMSCIEGLPDISVINKTIYDNNIEVIALFIRSGINMNIKSSYPGIDHVLPFEAAVYDEHVYAADMLLHSGCSCGVHSLRNNHELNDDITNELKELLEKWNVHKNNVIPLKQRCRLVILNHLCPQADKKIIELPLPLILIKYLMIPELDDIIEACMGDPHFYKNLK